MVEVSLQEKELYSTNFSEWGDYETAAKEEETVVKWNTKYMFVICLKNWNDAADGFPKTRLKGW